MYLGGGEVYLKIILSQLAQISVNVLETSLVHAAPGINSIISHKFRPPSSLDYRAMTDGEVNDRLLTSTTTKYTPYECWFTLQLLMNSLWANCIAFSKKEPCSIGDNTIV